MPRTLYGRMLAVSAVATLLALAIAGAVIAGVLGRFVTEGLDRRLDAEVLLLASVVDPDGRVDRGRLTERAAALEAGPDWRWRIAGPDGVVGSEDFPALGDAPPLPPGPAPMRGPHPREGAQEDGVAVHARELTLTTRRGPVTLTAAAPRDVVQRPIRGALAPLLIALAVLAAMLTTALLVQLRVGLRPLRRLAEEVAEIRAGRATRVDEDQPAELRPLALELNALAADNAAALATARASAANLAHALKTPVATLAIDLRDQPRHAVQVARIDRTIRHHLARARAAAINQRTATPVRAAVMDLVTAVRRIAGERAPAVAIDIPDELAVAVDAQDVDELLGNLLDNAVRHAASQVTVAATREGRMVAIVVGDDGPGIPPAECARVVQPGTRLDERGDGHGFGLAIVAELTALYGGTVSLDEAPAGGLAATLLLPSA